MRVVKYWNKAPVSVITASSVNNLKRRLDKVWTEVLPHLSDLLQMTSIGAFMIFTGLLAMDPNIVFVTLAPA